MTLHELEETVTRNVCLASGGPGPLAAEASRRVLDAAQAYARQYSYASGLPKALRGAAAALTLDLPALVDETAEEFGLEPGDIEPELFDEEALTDDED